MSNVLKGTIATEGTMKGNLATVFAKDGEDGTNGKSAYEIALDNGFEGTEAEWLESLKGEAGNSGVYVGSGEMPEDCNVQIDPEGDVFEITQETGDSETKVMSQKAVTEALANAGTGSGGSGDFDGEKEFISKNLFNVDTISDVGKYANWVTGKIETTSAGATDWCHSDYIPVVVGKKYTYSGGGRRYYGNVTARKTYFDSYCYYDANKAFVSGERIRATKNTTLTIPENVAYIIINFSFSTDAQDEVQFEKGETATSYTPYFAEKYYLPKLVVKKEQIEDFNEEDPTEENKSVLLHLPEKYDLVVGDTFELFYKGIMLCKDPYAYNILVNCGIGKAWGRKFEVTPTAVGTYPLTITVSDDNGNVIETASTNLVIEAKMTSPTSVKNVLCIGDSLTAGGEWVDEVFRRLTKTSSTTKWNLAAPTGEGLTNINFIGKVTTENGAGFEGKGGWRFTHYTSTTSTTPNYWVTCTHGKTDEDQESIYSDSNGVQWQLETLKENKLKFKPYSVSTATMPSSGTLTWVSGGVNTNNITFTASEQESGNPFVYNGVVDFASYCADLGVSTIDQCYILLGWNNASTARDTYKEQAKALLDLLVAFNSNIKITLMGLQMPSLDGLAQNYGATGVYANYRGLQEYVFAIDELYKEIASEYPDNVTFMNISGQFDTEYNMQSKAMAVNTRNTATEKVGSNGVHPAFYGYCQIADAVYRKFNNDNN